MNGPRRTACFAKEIPNYNFFTLDSTWFEYTDLLMGVVDNSGSHEQYAILSLADSQTICKTRSQTGSQTRSQNRKSD